MKLHQLFESSSDIIYHKTSLNNAVSILKRDEFILNATIVSDEEQKVRSRNKFYYMSTSRSKVGGYHLHDVTGAIFVLDGRKLSNNYHIKGIDYWPRGMRDQHPERFETEDRIFSNKPTIPNASKYIKEIHVLSPNGSISESISSVSGNIPTFFYENQKDWILQNKNKSFSVKSSNGDVPSTKSPVKSHSSIVLDLYELISDMDLRDMSTSAYGTLKDIKDLKISDVKSRFEDQSKSGRNRDHLQSLISEMRKKKLINLKGVLQYIYNNR